MKFPNLAGLKPVVDYCKLAFSDNGSPSSSRVLSLLHSLTACGCLIYLVIKTHTSPDGTMLAGWGTFAAAPYAINRVTNAWGNSNAPKPDVIVAPPGPQVSGKS